MVQKVHTLALLRHGQSLYNLENKFAGWADVDLTETGKKEAIQVSARNELISPSIFPEGRVPQDVFAGQAGELLRTEGFEFDFAYTSVLKRCIKTLQLILEELDQLWIPVQKDWRLNERHYGDLQDKNKAQTAQRYGEQQLQDWRRGFDTLPAPVEGGKQDSRFPGNDPPYSHIDPAKLPLTESLQLTVERVLPYWSDTIAPALKSGKNVIVVAHGNSIRALVKYLEDIPDEKIRSIEIATGVPVIYELDDQLKPIRHYYVGNAEAFKKRVGFLGIDIQAERLLKAFVSRGLELRDDIKYYAPDVNADVECLPVKPASKHEVVTGSDVLFLSGSLKHIEATLESIQSSLEDKQIVVAVSKDAKLDELQVLAGKDKKLVLALSENELQWQPKNGQDGPKGARVLLKKGNHASELDRNIITTLFEAAGYNVVKKDNLLTKT